MISSTKITLAGSKSITNRALILATLAQGKSLLHNVLFSDDTLACMQALKALGVNIEWDKNNKQCQIIGTSGQLPVQANQNISIWCQDSGTTLRFLLAVCAANLSGHYYFSGTSQLQSRPIDPLLQTLKKQGIEIIHNQNTLFPISIIKKNNRLIGGNLSIAGNKSSQFISALLMIAPYASKSMKLKVNSLISEPYVHLTCQMMQEFGVSVTFPEKNIFFIQAPQCYQGQINYWIEPDLSTASYFFAAAAITGRKITIPYIDKNTCKQGDIAFLDILEKMGCIIEYNQYQDKSITVIGPKQLTGITVDMNAISDTMMTLACIAPFAKTPTTITNIAHVRFKESDRIEATAFNLKQLGITTQTGQDYITIFPSTPKAGEVNSYADHRIAMAFSLLGLRVSGISIKDKACVSKTCPDFFDLWKNVSS